MSPETGLSLAESAKRAGVAVGIGALAFLLLLFLRSVGQGLMVLFTAIVFAVVLDGITRRVSRFTRLPHRLALAFSLFTLALPLAAVSWVGGAGVARQAPELRQNLQQAVRQIQGQLTRLHLIPSRATPGSSTQDLIARGAHYILRSRSSIADLAQSAVELFVVLVTGIYFAASPTLYITTVVKLVPKHRRPRIRQVLDSVGKALRRWMVGRFAAMLAVGLITGIGMWLLNVRLAVVLGFIAGVLTFVPYLGTIISLIPAVLSALLTSPMTAVYVTLLFAFAHFFEGYILTPLVIEEAVRLPPGWLITAQVFGALLGGMFGVLIATPVALVGAILVQTLYVEDMLGDQVHILGE
ncbi:MAG: AI-2E family transporter [Chromatiaceae bacterium]|jgi:predicted PurR-regulated permease PerM